MMKSENKMIFVYGPSAVGKEHFIDSVIKDYDLQSSFDIPSDVEIISSSKKTENNRDSDEIFRESKQKIKNNSIILKIQGKDFSNNLISKLNNHIDTHQTDIFLLFAGVEQMKRNYISRGIKEGYDWTQESPERRLRRFFSQVQKQDLFGKLYENRNFNRKYVKVFNNRYESKTEKEFDEFISENRFL